MTRKGLYIFRTNIWIFSGQDYWLHRHRPCGCTWLTCSSKSFPSVNNSRLWFTAKAGYRDVILRDSFSSGQSCSVRVPRVRAKSPEASLLLKLSLLASHWREIPSSLESIWKTNLQAGADNLTRMSAIAFSFSSIIHSAKPGIAVAGFIGFHVAPRAREWNLLLKAVPSVVLKLPTQKPHSITEPI